jgi:hypothetical protein
MGHPSGVAHPQGKQSVAIFYPFGHPTPYAYGSKDKVGHLNGNKNFFTVPQLSTITIREN